MSLRCCLIPPQTNRRVPCSRWIQHFLNGFSSRVGDHLEHRAEKWIRFSAHQRCSHHKRKHRMGSQKCKSTFGSDALVIVQRRQCAPMPRWNGSYVSLLNRYWLIRGGGCSPPSNQECSTSIDLKPLAEQTIVSLAPRLALPSAMPGAPASEAWMEVTSSGVEVPKPTRVSPITSGEIHRRALSGLAAWGAAPDWPLLGTVNWCTFDRKMDQFETAKALCDGRLFQFVHRLTQLG